ncbi:MAG: NAD(P)-dependent oxidoreductase [Pseudomonadota bacterium]
MKIGFVGLGIMGRPMALNLLKAGFDLTVWARRAESMQALVEHGAQTAAHPAALAAKVDVLISMVADAPDVRQVMLGEQGVAAGAQPGLLAVDMSTIVPDAARDIAAQLQQHGIDFLDAPVSGGEVGAIAGSLSIMVGGSVAGFERMQPVFAALGKNIVHIGASGAGQVAKAANQIITGVSVLMVAEALNFAAQSGVDPAKVRAALLGGFAYSKVLENHGQRMLERNFKPGFKAWMHDKDMNIVLQSGQAQGVSLPLSQVAAQLFGELLDAGLGEEDSIAVLKLLERHQTPD